MLLDRFLPGYEFNEVHTLRIDAPPERVFRSIKEVTAAEIPLFLVLMGLRALPARLLGGIRSRPAWTARRAGPLLDAVQKGGFVLLAEDPGRELVVGAVQQFWRLAGGLPTKRITTPEEFLTFDDPNYSKAVLNFYLIPSRDGRRCRVRTETRIHVPGAAARRKFALYWTLIYPGSALIRRMWLLAIRRRAERVKCER